jgi:hypothetical protein
MTDLPLHVTGTRDYAQGELFLLTEHDGGYQARVYNTTGFGPCPDAAFTAIDVEALAIETGCDRVWKNPRRFWMMDELTLALAGEPRELGGIWFNLAADMQMPASFDPGRDQSALAYHPMQIHRVTTYRFRAGAPVFLLRSPEGVTWVMQTYTDHQATDLTAAGLPGLGDRLTLPDGWAYATEVPDEDLVIDTHGVANIVSDDLANMYQGCIDGVHNCDPWA